MNYGCIGERLKHSFSKEIHALIADYDYEITEIEREDLSIFALKKDFKAINVTIPYKELIMPYMHHIDSHAEEIGAVNTVVNRDGKLFGYNTDFYGMSMLFSHAKIYPEGKKAAILGTGGTSKTSYAVLRSLGAKEIVKVSRDGKEGALTYSEFYEKHTDVEIIVNTTPLGMYPNILDSPLDLSKFPSLKGVIDAVYNPLRTTLVLDAIDKKIPAEGGLYMLVSQAVRASEIFLDTKYSERMLDDIYKKILREKENIVLTGMPASGKSTVGKLLSEKLGREFIDIDDMIEKKAGMPISLIFSELGESVFRDLESDAIRESSSLTGKVISTGGGAVLREENVKALRKNGRIYFIDRPLGALIPTENRPLAKNTDMIKKRFSERYPIYLKTADVRIDASADAFSVGEYIEKDFLK